MASSFQLSSTMGSVTSVFFFQSEAVSIYFQTHGYVPYGGVAGNRIWRQVKISPTTLANLQMRHHM